MPPALQLGFAEAHAGLARLAAAGGDPSTASQSLQLAIAAYESVLQAPEKLGGFRERCDVRWAVYTRQQYLLLTSGIHCSPMKRLRHAKQSAAGLEYSVT